MARRRTADSAVVRKSKRERRYGLQRQLTTEANRKRKWRRHIKKHPNNIKGMERIRKLLNME